MSPTAPSPSAPRDITTLLRSFDSGLVPAKFQGWGSMGSLIVGGRKNGREKEEGGGGGERRSGSEGKSSDQAKTRKEKERKEG